MQFLVRLGHHDGKIAWPRYGSTGVKYLSQELEIRVDNVQLPACVLLY